MFEGGRDTILFAQINMHNNSVHSLWQLLNRGASENNDNNNNLLYARLYLYNSVNISSHVKQEIGINFDQSD